MSDVSDSHADNYFMLLDVDDIRQGFRDVRPGWAMGSFYPESDVRHSKDFEIKEWDRTTIQTDWRNHANLGSEYISVLQGVLTVILGSHAVDGKGIEQHSAIEVRSGQRLVLKRGVWRKFTGTDEVKGVSIRKSPDASSVECVDRRFGSKCLSLLVVLLDAGRAPLTIEYLSFSLDFFRQAKADCRLTFDTARRAGLARIVLAGRSDLAEIALICALETGVEIVGVVDEAAGVSRFMGVPAFDSFERVKEPFDAIVVTDMANGPKSYAHAIAALGSEHVLVPKLLRSSTMGTAWS